MAEAGASDAMLVAVAGHMSRRMLEHYSHVRMAAKRTTLEKLQSGLMGGPSATSQPESWKANRDLTSQSAPQPLPPTLPSVCIFLKWMVGATGLEPVTSCV